MASSTSALRRAAVLMAGGGVYGTAVYLAYHYTQMNSKKCPSEGTIDCLHNSTERIQQFQRIAPTYDHDIGVDECFMGINLLRRALLGFHARGDCLEVGAGTARNLPYYRMNSNLVHRVVLVDSSDQMLSQAKDKILKLKPDKRSRIAILQADAAQLKLPSSAFDTVIDTFGLCSYHDPVKVLNELARVCKPTGKILLLEHGRSHSWNFVTRHLDAHAPKHAANWGCIWNRDLDAILEAANDSLDVQVLSRYHFGTTYYVVCRTQKEAR